MKVFFAGICLFFSTLFSCQQKGEDFESVSADEFATLIADSDIQRLDVRTVAEYSEEHIPYQCAGRTVCCHCGFYTSKR